MLAQEDHISTAFRKHARVWTKIEFDAHLGRLAKNAGLITADVHGLPSTGSMVRYDVMQFAHAMRLRDHLSATDRPLVFVMDGDAGLRVSFATVFQPEIAAGRADLAIIDFDKGMTNDKRNMAVAAGRAELCAATGMTGAEVSLIPSEYYAGIVDDEVASRLVGQPAGDSLEYHFSTKIEHNRWVLLLTERPGLAAKRKVRLMRLATLRSVDTYFHRFRSNVRFASRPQVSTGGHGRTRGGIISTTPRCSRRSSRSTGSTTAGSIRARTVRRRRCGSGWRAGGSASWIYCDAIAEQARSLSKQAPIKVENACECADDAPANVE